MGRKTISNIGVFAFSLLATTSAVYLYSPVIGSHADESSTARVKVNVGDVMALTLDKTALDLSAMPNNFVSGAINATVSTNSQYGYTLTLEDLDDNTNLTNTNENISDVFTSAFDNTKTSAEMGANTWGFSLDATNFSKIPVNGSSAALKHTTVPMSTETETTSVTFGAKLGNIASGTYTDKVLFTAYVNGQDEPETCGVSDTLHDISTMQEMTSCVCKNTTTPTTSATLLDWDGTHHGDSNYVPRIALTDTRDGNKYLVSKLADGNCWMSQNLGLDFTQGVDIVASNNDGTTTTVTPNMSIQTSDGTFWEYSDDNWRAYKPQSDMSYFEGGLTASSSPSGTGDAYLWEKAGNYYNWYSTTAGSGWVDMNANEASSSICPKGWMLPKYEGNKSFNNLFETTYNLSGSTGAAKLRTDPFNFTLAGGYAYNGTGMVDRGVYGNYWTSTMHIATSFHVGYFYFSTSEIVSQDYDNNGLGLSVRCVAI